MSEEDKTVRDSYRSDYSDFYHRQKPEHSDSYAQEAIIPQNIRKGMMVEFGQTIGMVRMTQVDFHGKELGIQKQLDGQKNFYALVVRTETYNRWMDILWEEEVYRIHAARGLQVREVKEPPPGASNSPRKPSKSEEAPVDQEVLKQALMGLVKSQQTTSLPPSKSSLHEIISALTPWVIKK
jgi:hypothetical protein